MFSYVFGLLAFLLVFYNPILQLLEGGGSSSGVEHPQIRRTPRPQVNLDLLALEDDTANQTSHECPEDAFSVHVFSREPLVIYVENFLSLDERKHLLEISEPLFEPATITHNGGTSTHRDATVRDSEVAVIPRSPTVRCIEARARAFQGWRDEVWVERLRVQRYRPGGHYGHHFDWSSNRGGWGRVSTFMVYVDDGEGALRGGGTEFPWLRAPADRRWCRFVECAEDGSVEGLGNGGGGDGEKVLGGAQEMAVPVFKALPGNAVYWENFRSDGTGRGFNETWHAGLPVEEGVKVGLNIWSWGRIE